MQGGLILSNLTINIGNKNIGGNNPPYFIADIGANHDGSLERAFKLIELAKESGADAAKFQNFKAERIVSEKGFQTLKGKLSHQSSWEKSVFEVYKDASLSYEWTAKLKEKCNEVGIEYMTSPYDFTSVDQTDQYLNAFKIGSGDITWLEIIEYIAKKNKPMILSTGASDIEDVDRAVKVAREYNKEIILLQCNTNYTAKRENFKYINLNVLNEYKKRYPDLLLGLSDHTKGDTAVLGAIALGASVIEKHFTDDNDRIGPDHKFAMTPDDWQKMVERSNKLFDALGDGNKKIEKNEQESKIVQRRALRYDRELSKGDIISEEDIFPLRPISKEGIPPFKKKDIVGKKINKKVKKDDLVRWEDF